MSFLPESLLLDSGISNLLHIPEALERMAAFQPARGHEVQRIYDAGSRAGDDRGIGNVPVDILETSKSYTFFLDVPGLPKSEIQVNLENDKILVIRSNGKRKREDGEEEDGKYLRLERKAAPPRFTRKFRLPYDSNTSGITAKCEDGVLTVVVEKLPPPPEPKTVEVAVV
ncbi:hypothetical protein IEQ34_015212 [Dendrobium chrysotoxum]|uniref:SHSP domain-containing protein n=1 Tax=Dendrobium chrysotoxum TaxID=161865 RepID=A0AAV7GHC6_DENCH|nr:hypothetical protein IEQ34_015212 [Dendrobium chrysotoxum]